MPRYFFDFTDDERVAQDMEGHTLPSPDAARAEALRALVEIYAFEPPEADRRRVCCSVRGEGGAVVYRASLTLDGERNPNR